MSQGLDETLGVLSGEAAATVARTITLVGNRGDLAEPQDPSAQPYICEILPTSLPSAVGVRTWPPAAGLQSSGPSWAVASLARSHYFKRDCSTDLRS
jgi:hypothetical protein